MGKAKNTSIVSVYLEDKHTKYLKIQAMLNDSNASEYLREIINRDMNNNSDIVSQLEKMTNNK